MKIEKIRPEEIEARSFAIIREELEDMGIRLPQENAAVILRCIHTSADFDYAETMTYSENAVEISYFGKVVKKPYIGDPKRQVEYEDIRRVNRLMNRTAWICELLCLGILTWVAAGCGWL